MYATIRAQEFDGHPFPSQPALGRKENSSCRQGQAYLMNNMGSKHVKFDICSPDFMFEMAVIVTMQLLAYLY